MADNEEMAPEPRDPSGNDERESRGAGRGTSPRSPNADHPATDLPAGEMPGGDTADGHTADGDTADDHTADDHTADGDISEGDIATGDISQGDIATGDIAAGDIAAGDLAAREIAAGGAKPQGDAQQAADAASSPLYVVGIGASAGGLASIESLFERIPGGGRLSFVLVQHLSPDHRSLMAEIMVKHTTLKVRTAEHGMPLEAETIHLIPPSKILRVRNGLLHLTDRVEHQLHFPIDAFFMSIAEEYGSRAIAVVLSGTGSDGTEGIRRVKQAGGTVLVQDDTAQFDGMPRSAISTGLADFIMPPHEIAAKIIDLTRHSLDLPVIESASWQDETLPRILGAILRLTGHDFEGYRHKTLRRRIEKRMWLRQTKAPEVYAALLENDPDEVRALSRELLIGVTWMFRDQKAFDAIRDKVLPQILKPDANLRIWVVGCSTGEEAYSIAILIDEYIREHRLRASFRIFATDIDDRAIQQAGSGVFPAQSLQSVEPDLLARCFKRDGAVYRITSRIRERVVFAKHDVIKDPPFTKVDLITCRNLLIYQLADLQSRTIGMLQFALRDNGFLWLGPSESLGSREGAFRTIDKRWRIFRRAEVLSDEQAFRRAETTASTARRGVVERQVHRQEAMLLSKVCSTIVRGEQRVAIVLSESDTILYVFGDTSDLFAIPEGRPTQMLAKALASPLGNIVPGLVRRARRDKSEQVRGRASFKTQSGEPRTAEIQVQRLESTAQETLHVVLIGLESTEASTSDDETIEDIAVRERVAELESELGEAQSNLQMTIEELESSNEELQSANEELLASNEELQSTNEELHSVNEELHTVNAEYQRKLAEQHVLTADMEHLLQTTDIGTIFLDSDHCVRRYTPAVTRVIPLLPTDQGRPIGHIKNLLVDVDLEEIARQTMSSNRIEQRVRTTDNYTYELRAVPYYDYGEHQDGVVMTLFDVTALENARRKAEEGERRFHQVVANIDEVIWIRERSSASFLYLSPMAETLWGRPTEDLVANPELWLFSVHDEDRERVRIAYDRGMQKGALDIEYRVRTPDGVERWVRDRGFPIVDDKQQMLTRLAGVITDITAAKQTENELRDQARQMSRLALIDALTGLPNRRGFEQHLSEELVRARRNGDILAAVLIDCDNFKSINDSHGHNAGDDVLREVASRLVRSLRPTDVLARIGGDEFVALLPATRNAEALRVAERMRVAISDKPVFAAGKDLTVTVSIGVDTLRTKQATTSTVLAELHHGLARSKSRGKNRVADARGDGATLERPEQLLALLRDQKSITVVGQAIHNIVEGRVVGYELLSRGPRGDFENPASLFRLATDLDMLAAVDAHCLRQCLLEAKRVLQHRKDLHVHLNVFPATLTDGRDRQLTEAFAEVGSLGNLCLEISEQQVVGEPSYLRDSLAELRRMGVRIAVDDVGFGRSSLESLILLEPEVIKIDRAFVDGVSKDPLRRSSLSRLLNVSRGLDTQVVAEGVETPEDSLTLIDLGVTLAQGFLWDRPSPLPSWSQN